MDDNSNFLLDIVVSYGPYVLVALLLVIYYFLQAKQKNRYGARWVQRSFDIRESLLTRNEQAFYQALKEVVGDKFVIMAKVRLEDIFKAKKGQDHTAARNMIKSRHVDFLLCEPDSLSPVLGIELDDKSHLRSDRVKRDIFVNRLFESNQLPLLRIKSSYKYDPMTIKKQIISILRE